MNYIQKLLTYCFISGDENSPIVKRNNLSSSSKYYIYNKYLLYILHDIEFLILF